MYCPRRRGVDALLSPSSYRISELQVLNTVEVSDNQRQYLYVIFYFTICFLLFYFKDSGALFKVTSILIKQMSWLTTSLDDN